MTARTASLCQQQQQVTAHFGNPPCRREQRLCYRPLTKIVPVLHLAPRTQNAAYTVIHSLRQLLAPGYLPLFTSDGLNVYFYALPGPFWTLAHKKSERTERAPVAGGSGVLATYHIRPLNQAAFPGKCIDLFMMAMGEEKDRTGTIPRFCERMYKVASKGMNPLRPPYAASEQMKKAVVLAPLMACLGRTDG